MHHNSKNWVYDQSGIAMIEFALILPLFITVFLAMIELTNYVKARQRVDNATANIINLVNQRREIDNNSIEFIVNSTEDILANFGRNGWGVIVTAVSKPETQCKPYSVWQVRKEVGANIKSRIAEGVNQPITYPLPIENDDHIITAEVIINYRPVLDTEFTRRILNLSDNSITQSLTIARPRYVRFTRDPVTLRRLTPICL